MEAKKTGYIYKLCSKDINVKEIYIGSTQNITRRKCQHKTVCNNNNDKRHNVYVYQYIRENGGVANWDIVVIERIEYKESFELHTRERHHIELLDAKLNSQVPTRTLKEYYEQHKEQLIQNAKQYNIEHAEQVARRRNHKHDCECGKKYTIPNKTRHLQSKKHTDSIARLNNIEG